MEGKEEEKHGKGQVQRWWHREVGACDAPEVGRSKWSDENSTWVSGMKMNMKPSLDETGGRVSTRLGGWAEICGFNRIDIC